MRVLVIGGGGREHALAWKLSKSSRVSKLYCCPGNAGTSRVSENLRLGLDNHRTLALWAVENEIDLTVVGPEKPLADGIVDVFSGHGLKIFGPTKSAARIESSKSFAKELMNEAGVATPEGRVFRDLTEAENYLGDRRFPIVIKADGLAAGKGVVIAEDVDVARTTLRDFMLEGRHGESGKQLIIEDFVEGQEASIIAMVDGDTVLPFVVSQDYKRLLDDDDGPNTGGMGAISPTSVLNSRRLESLASEIFLPVLRKLQSRGIRYQGFLYAGVIVDREGKVQVLEFNCRLGDPETQVLLPRLESDLVEALEAAVNGRLKSVELRWRRDCAAAVVASSGGYPGTVDDGKPIEGLFDEDDGRVVFHAGTVRDPDDPERILTKGGRILAVSALGASMDEALGRAYEGIQRIHFDGMHYRGDIGGGVKGEKGDV